MKVKILPLLLSSLTLLSPAGHASAAPGISVGFSPEGSAEALVLGVIDRAQADMPELADRYLQHWQSRWDAGTDYRLPY